MNFDNFVAGIRQRLPEIFEAFDLQRTINQSVMDRIEAKSHDIPSIVIDSMYSRACYAFESAVTLFERGLQSDGISCVRNLLESSFIMTALISEPHLTERYTQSDLFFRYRSMKGLVSNWTPKSPYSKEKLEHELAAIGKEIEEKQAKHTQMDFWAEKAGMSDEYRVAYRHWSQSSHSGPRAVERDALTMEDGKVKEFKFGPNFQEISFPGMKAIDYCQRNLNALAGHFSISITEEEKQMVSRINELQSEVEI